MNYQQYLLGRDDAIDNKPRQSPNKDYLYGYTETLGASLISGDRIQYDWDMPSVDDTPSIKVSMSAEIEGKEHRTIFRVKDIGFIHFRDRKFHYESFKIAMQNPDSSLVHISQIYRKI